MRRNKWQIPLVSGDEHDAISGWRRVLKFRPGERVAAKRGYQRRARRHAKHELREIFDCEIQMIGCDR